MPGNNRVETVRIYIDVVDSARVETCHHIERVGYKNGINSTRPRGKVDRVVLHIPEDVGTAGVGPGYAKAVEGGVHHLKLFSGAARHFIQHDVVDIGSVRLRYVIRSHEDHMAVGTGVAVQPDRMVGVFAEGNDTGGIDGHKGGCVGGVAHDTHHNKRVVIEVGRAHPERHLQTRHREERRVGKGHDGHLV